MTDVLDTKQVAEINRHHRMMRDYLLQAFPDSDAILAVATAQYDSQVCAVQDALFKLVELQIRIVELAYANKPNETLDDFKKQMGL